MKSFPWSQIHGCISFYGIYLAYRPGAISLAKMDLKKGTPFIAGVLKSHALNSFSSVSYLQEPEMLVLQRRDPWISSEGPSEIVRSVTQLQHHEMDWRGRKQVVMV